MGLIYGNSLLWIRIRYLFGPGSGMEKWIRDSESTSRIRTLLVAVTERVTVPIEHIVLVNRKIRFFGILSATEEQRRIRISN